MLVIRGTKKLRDRVAGGAVVKAERSTTQLGEWFANALFWRPQVALLVNQRTLLPVFMPLAPAATLLHRAPAAIAAVLRAHGTDEAFVERELAAMNDVRLAPTNDRSVVGVMNEYALHATHLRGDRSGDLTSLSLAAARIPLGPLRQRTGFPDRQLAALAGFEVRRGPTPSPAGRTASRAAPRRALQVKVALDEITPPIWRRLLVDESCTMAELHETIQAAFGWWNTHLYQFRVKGSRYGIPDPDDTTRPRMRDARRTRLVDVASPGASFRYTYDFGDNWQHTVTVEQLAFGVTAQLPACTDGERAGPPEDCGGPLGYGELLGILADPTHHEHAWMTEWARRDDGRPWDPDEFDPRTFAVALHQLRGAAHD